MILQNCCAKAGASLISPFVGRLDDINQDGMIVSASWLRSSPSTRSIRGPRGLHPQSGPHDSAALAGAHIATVPFKIVQQMVHHR